MSELWLLTEPLEDPLGFLGGFARPGSIIVVTLVLSYVTLVFGELARKRVAMQKAERWGLLMARPLAFLSKLMRPIVWLLSHSTDITVRLMGGDPSVQREEVTEEELRDMLALQATFTQEQRQIIDGAFGIAERSLDEILLPRRDVFVIDASTSCRDALVQLAASVEELVGEIYDETDPDLAEVIRQDDGTIVLPGRFPIHDLPDIGVDLPDGDYTTVAGLLLELLGRIPVAGDQATTDGWQLEVRAMRERAVTEISLVPTADRPDESAPIDDVRGARTADAGIESGRSER